MNYFIFSAFFVYDFVGLGFFFPSELNLSLSHLPGKTVTELR